MDIRVGKEKDYAQLAEMKWLHCEEDDIDYHENCLADIDKDAFIAEFIEFLHTHKEYTVFVACDGKTVASAMFVYLIPKTPKPNRNSKYIAYLTNVYTRKEYRNNGTGTALLQYIKEYLTKERCEMLFAWPSAHSVKWYERNGFHADHEMLACDL